MRSVFLVVRFPLHVVFILLSLQKKKKIVAPSTADQKTRNATERRSLDPRHESEPVFFSPTVLADAIAAKRGTACSFFCPRRSCNWQKRSFAVRSSSTRWVFPRDRTFPFFESAFSLVRPRAFFFPLRELALLLHHGALPFPLPSFMALLAHVNTLCGFQQASQDSYPYSTHPHR